jgi:hypothetical protein
MAGMQSTLLLIQSIIANTLLSSISQSNQSTLLTVRAKLHFHILRELLYPNPIYQTERFQS